MPDVDRLSALIEPLLAREGVELVDVEVAGSRRRPIVRVYVDRPGGVGVDDCARISRLLEAGLETAAAVPETYVLEVSSPGLDRPLRERRHFERFVGRDVEVRLFAPLQGRRRIVGTLEQVADAADDSFAITVVDPDGARWTFADRDIAKARLHWTW
ncbi:MAG TPA: ribosome maturation factor RimP [Gemmatimonadota bacterium]|nr:ribosome maturation factor RimP [Gemmatimonadota bacterium]